MAIFTYNLPKAKENFANHHCAYATLSNYDTLLEVAIEHNYVSSDALEKLKAWKKDPSDESWMDK